MRSSLIAVCVFVGGAFAFGCAGPYSAAPEKLSMPKKKKVKPGAAVAGADVCKTNFKGEPVRVPPRQKRNEADGYAQDADNLLSGIGNTSGDQRTAKARDAMSKARDALAVDPYSPRAHLVMASAYAWAGKKKCALAMLERLKELKTVPEEQTEAIKMTDKVKGEKAFASFKSDAEAAVAD